MTLNFKLALTGTRSIRMPNISVKGHLKLKITARTRRHTTYTVVLTFLSGPPKWLVFTDLSFSYRAYPASQNTFRTKPLVAVTKHVIFLLFTC